MTKGENSYMNIRDIAKLCGVSASTVSKVLHDDKTISEETRKKVLYVVKEYNYVPYSEVLKNAAPRMDMIAVVLDEEQSFYKELLYGIEDSAFDYGYNIVVCNIAEGEERRKKYLQILENKGISGMIISCRPWRSAAGFFRRTKRSCPRYALTRKRWDISA